MNFAHCPYDGEDISAEAFAGGFLMISCEYCGAAWELHNALMRRIREPDIEAVKRAQSAARARREQSGAAEMLGEVAAEAALGQDSLRQP